MEFFASEAVRFLVEQITVGGLQKLGGDSFSKLLRQLRGLLDYKFANKLDLEQAHEQQEVLEADIVEECRRDSDFYKNLQQLVTQLQEAEKKRQTINTTQSTNWSGVTQNTHNSGQMGDVVAGDKFTGDKFR